MVDPVPVADAITDETILIWIMHANNEVVTIQPMRTIAKAAHARGVLVHTDAAQTVGKLPVKLHSLDMDLLTVVGHKCCAPKGAVALMAAIRDRVACSTGSARHAGQAEQSSVLLAMERDAELASAALRLRLRWDTT